MSALTTTTTTDVHVPVGPTDAATPALSSPDGAVRLRDVVRGEWIKLRSVRSSMMTLVGAGVVTVAFGMIFSATAGSDDVAAPGPLTAVTDPVAIALGAVNLTQMIIGVLAVLLVAGEYSTGLIRTTMAAVGRRVKLLTGKAIVVGTATAVAMAAFVAGALWLGQAVYAGDGETLSLLTSEALGVIVGSTVYLAGIALIGVALGFIFRSTAGAIGVLFGGVFIGPQLMQLLPDSFTDVVLKYLPSEAGDAMMSRVSDPDLLSTGAAYAVFAAWVLGLLALAAILLRKRDA